MTAHQISRCILCKRTDAEAGDDHDRVLFALRMKYGLVDYRAYSAADICRWIRALIS